MNPQNTIAITVRYIAPTNTKGSRVRLKTPLFGRTKVIPYLHELRDAEETALSFLEKHDISPLFRASMEAGECVLIFSFNDVNKICELFSI